MDFNAEIAAHLHWKIKLRMFINGAGENLDRAVVGQDNQCSLGRWLYGEGLKYQHHVAYQTLLKKHTRFHQHAAEVVQKMEQGDSKKAAELIGINSPFQKESLEISLAIEALKKVVSS